MSFAKSGNSKVNSDSYKRGGGGGDKKVRCYCYGKLDHKSKKKAKMQVKIRRK